MLDCSLGREMVWPVADRLRSRNIPFVFSTGYGPAGVDPRFEGTPILNKPFPIRMLQQALVPFSSRREARTSPLGRRQAVSGEMADLSALNQVTTC